MQDRYVGDIGDFAKLTMLRYICKSTDFRLGVVWCRTESGKESNNDGKHRGYRSYTDVHSVRLCDGELFDGFEQFDCEVDRLIAALHQFLPANSRFFNITIQAPRSNWIANSLRATVDCDFVFFDPDNGIEFNPGKKKCSDKHVSIEELRTFWNRGHSLIVYHQLGRQPEGHVWNVQRNISDLTKIFPDANIRAIHIRRGTARVFFVLIQPGHTKKFPPTDGKSVPWYPLTLSKSAWRAEIRVEADLGFPRASLNSLKDQLT